MYQEFLDGYGYYKIAERLTEDGVVTECGNLLWSWSTLKKILTNEKYKGGYTFSEDLQCRLSYKVESKKQWRLT
ncbi:recombinase family protein [Clostridium tagluense]|uniref:recombinase family protein n=1 Tax=Clostridium tagluense TaxID=360422 RepID=UPI0035583437